jgi:hypothetical protein
VAVAEDAGDVREAAEVDALQSLVALPVRLTDQAAPALNEHVENDQRERNRPVAVEDPLADERERREAVLEADEFPVEDPARQPVEGLGRAPPIRSPAVAAS